jgi:hypothetical protein
LLLRRQQFFLPVNNTLSCCKGVKKLFCGLFCFIGKGVKGFLPEGGVANTKGNTRAGMVVMVGLILIGFW